MGRRTRLTTISNTWDLVLTANDTYAGAWPGG